MSEISEKKEATKKAIYKKWWFWVIAVIFVAYMASGGDDDKTETELTTASNEQSQENNSTEKNVEERNTEAAATEENKPQEDPKEPEVKTYSSGTYIVGNDIEPGIYKSEGNVVYWARLSGFSGELNEIIANGNPQGTDIVEIKESDKGFETSGGGGHWFKIEDDYEGELLTEFGDGTYLVGKDIEPGTYRSDGEIQIIGYWARLTSFSGELDSIIANGNPDGSVVVEISANDIGFQTSGSGTWKKID